jgi:sugar phosphate isomerase/epimerase
MRLSFSTLGCPDWSLRQIIDLARRERYDGIELRFVEGDDALWKRPELTGSALGETKAALRDANLVVSCIDTGCFFHHPDAASRGRALDEARRMLALAAALDAPAIRVFGDRVQPGATREATEGWIADAMHTLGDDARAAGLEAWLETHGDFAAARDTSAILRRAASPGAGVVWDPANAFAERGERPDVGYPVLGGLVRHVHVKDLRAPEPAVAAGGAGCWTPALIGAGHFPAGQVIAVLLAAGYRGHVSFEWEKKWHPSIPDPNVALPHFARWAREAVARRSRDQHTEAAASTAGRG